MHYENLKSSDRGFHPGLHSALLAWGQSKDSHRVTCFRWHQQTAPQSFIEIKALSMIINAHSFATMTTRNAKALVSQDFLEQSVITNRFTFFLFRIMQIARIFDLIYLAVEFKVSLTNNIEDKHPPGSFKNKDWSHEYQLKLYNWHRAGTGRSLTDLKITFTKASFSYRYRS